MLYTWEKFSRTVNPYKNIIPGLSPVVLAFRQFSVICFHFLYMYPVFLFPCDCSSQSFLCSHLFWACACASYMLPEYFGLYLHFQIHRNIVLRIMLWNAVCSPKRTTDFCGVACVTAKYISGLECIFSPSLLCGHDIKIPWKSCMWVVSVSSYIPLAEEASHRIYCQHIGAINGAAGSRDSWSRVAMQTGCLGAKRKTKGERKSLQEMQSLLLCRSLTA